MRRFIKLIWFVVLARFLGTCVEPYNPDIPKYDNILVVDGLITDLDEPYYVDLTRSMPYEDIDPDRETGATVLVIDDEDNVYEFAEMGRGRYASDPSVFRGEIGRSYKLNVITSAGDEFESEWVELRKVPEIDTLYWTFEEKETDDPDEVIQGVQVYLSTEDPENETWYYRWEWIETWEFTAPFIAAGRPTLHRCWRTENSSDIEIATSKHLATDAIKNHSLAFISQNTNRLGIQYSMLVRQYSLSAEAYSFWKRIQDINQKMGSLFDPTPMAVTGNIHHVTDPEVPVLGYFQASSVSVKRLFVDRSDLPEDLIVSTGYEYCEIMILADPTQIQIEDMYRDGWVFLDTYTFIGITYYRFTNSQSCYDCTAEGVNKMPPYWPESKK
jgi:hypothetical protein